MKPQVWAWFLLTILLIWTFSARASEPDVRVLVGGAVGLITDGDPQLEPMARIDVGWDLYDGSCTQWGTALKEKEDGTVVEVPACVGEFVHDVRLHVLADLTSLPGDAIDLADPTSFRAMSFEVGGSWRPLEQINASLYVGGGFATRFATRGAEPVFEAPKYLTFGLLFDGKSRAAWLQPGIGPDQRLDGTYVMSVQLTGGLDLVRAETGRLEGTSLSLLVNAILGMEHDPEVSRRDLVQVSVAAGWGQK